MHNTRNKNNIEDTNKFKSKHTNNKQAHKQQEKIVW